MNAERNTTTAPPTEITRFWRHVFGGQTGQLMVWTGLRNESGEIENIRSNNFNYPKADKTAAAWALSKGEEGREVFFCAHLLTASQRIKANAGEVITLWGDLDGAAVPNGSLLPTAVVESSPGRYHCYWRLSDAIPPETAERLNQRLALKIGADTSGFDLSQLLRVPGTKNHKYEDCPLVEVRDLDGALSYAPSELERLLPTHEEGHAGEDTGDGPPVMLSPDALRVWRGEAPKLKENGEVDRSAALLHIGRVLYDAGATRAPITAALRGRDIALNWRVYVDRRDADKQYNNIFNELERSGRNSRVRVIFGAEAPQAQEWPEMDDAAYRGLFGEAVELVEPHTEGDPVAVLTSALVAFGSMMGRGPYMQIGATRHRTNLFVGNVGKTSKGRKGSSWSPVKSVSHAVDSEWAEGRILSGLSSGEGLISEVRDPLQVPDNDGGMKTVDPGVKDKRLLVMEGELSQALKVMKREGNTLSPVMRNAWDGETLRTMVKHSPHRATDPHISVLGHITLEELVKHLTETEMANGLANRFLWVLVKRSKLLPFGGEWHTVDLAPLSRHMVGALEYANRDVRMSWADDAKALWCEAYEVLAEDRPGLFGAVTARAEAQTLRLSMLYALADHSQEIRHAHVESALAVWEFAEASALRIFGGLIGDIDADKVLGALKEAEGGLTRTDVRDLFGRNKGRQEIDRIREVLIKANKLRVSLGSEDGSKKPVERWFAA